jgi:hypothetical protein
VSGRREADASILAVVEMIDVTSVVNVDILLVNAGKPKLLLNFLNKSFIVISHTSLETVVVQGEEVEVEVEEVGEVGADVDVVVPQEEEAEAEAEAEVLAPAEKAEAEAAADLPLRTRNLVLLARDLTEVRAAADLPLRTRDLALHEEADPQGAVADHPLRDLALLYEKQAVHPLPREAEVPLGNVTLTWC